jgi:hypothetical protein
MDLEDDFLKLDLTELDDLLTIDFESLDETLKDFDNWLKVDSLIK